MGYCKVSRTSMAIILGLMSMFLFSPQLILAGNLNPSTPPGPTMKTLDQIPPTWSQKLQCDETACPRFELVMGGYAVLDKETGLVWEQAPGSGVYDWNDAIRICYNKGVGGRKGFRLPMIEELLSLVDPQADGLPLLPSGYPFSNVQVTYYWSATTVSSNAELAWAVTFAIGNLYGSTKTNSPFCVWCVRGGHGYDAY